MRGGSRRWFMMRQKCERKTAKGNTFSTMENAEAAALHKQRMTGCKTIQAYKCLNCPCYHIGRSKGR